MQKALVMVIVAILFCGCERENVSGPEEIRSSTQVVQVVVVDGFGDIASMLTDSLSIRVGRYFDLSPYDSLLITFSAKRLVTQSPFDEILVRIGPAYYLRDSVYAAQENISLKVKASALSKRHYCALTFLTDDSRTHLQLSDLRVVGWMTL
jgi:hypothetical protein